ncbi:hypothetical protein [Ensifer adhaerens]|uniref:hypothetical protein n=1 Tax=Ensifer adhaerens TaxID=106592 RepID=UPI00131A031B|nr:hypothetical protein [Ensifer adhaerens]
MQLSEKRIMELARSIAGNEPWSIGCVKFARLLEEEILRAQAEARPVAELKGGVQNRAAPGLDIKAAAGRLMGWRLPDDFSPDCFVVFDRVKAKFNNSWPVGTNLLTTIQAEEMLRYAFADQLPRASAATVAEPGAGEWKMWVDAWMGRQDIAMRIEAYDELIAAQSGQRAGVAEGWKLVPLEPTPQMLEQIKFLDDITDRAMTARYKAMLAAAPTQQGGEQP